MRERRARWIGSLLLTLASSFCASALANGRFPASNLIVFDPNDANHLIVRTTFGLLESRNAGRDFGFVCESALRLGVEEDPMLAFTDSGPLVVSTFGGLLTSIDGCTFDAVPALQGEIIPDLAAFAAAPDTLVAFRMLGLGGGAYQAALLRSDDAAKSFREMADFPTELLPLTVDVAARDSERVYLTARRSSREDFDSALLVSRDGGVSFETRPIPGTAGQRLAYIAAVDPNDVDRLYLRIDDPDGTVLLETGDGGESFDRRFVAAGPLPGFAVSSAGSIAVGGPEDGIWCGRSQALGRCGDVRPSCLAYDAADRLYACADAQRVGFSLGRSVDSGESFEALLDFSDLCGSSSCGSASDVGALCARDWVDIGATLEATCAVGSGPDESWSGDGSAPTDGTRPPNHGCSSSASAHDAGAELAPRSCWTLLAYAAVAFARRRMRVAQ